jgi:hypothetical protein
VSAEREERLLAVVEKLARRSGDARRRRLYKIRDPPHNEARARSQPRQRASLVSVQVGA